MVIFFNRRIGLLVFAIYACNPQGSSRSNDGRPAGDRSTFTNTLIATSTEIAVSTDMHQAHNSGNTDSNRRHTPSPEEEEDVRPSDQFLCEEAEKLLARVESVSFANELSVLCKDGKTTKEFQTAQAQVFKGTGEPVVELFKFETNEAYVTDIYLIFSLSTSAKDPSALIGLNPQDSFANGLIAADSEMFVKVLDRKTFPPKSASIEKVLLDYDLKFAKGAGVYDRRKTELNTYQLAPHRKDVSIAAEHLLERETNQYYHNFKSLMVAISNNEEKTDLIFVSHSTVKNRIDPARIKITLLELHAVVVRTLDEFFKSKLPAER